jgi:hypothetical protein
VKSPVATPDEQQIREVQDRVTQLSVQAEIPRDIVERVTLALHVELTGTGPEHPRATP